MDASTPHDALFKRVFTQPEEAASLFRSFLPTPIVAALDWSSLKLEPGSYVDATLAARYTDLLFSCRTSEGTEAALYLVLEHQSSEHRLMAYRMAAYVMRVLDAWLAERPKARALPVVVPLVVHLGPRPWRGSRELRDLFAGPEELLTALGPALPSLRFLLEDLTAAEEAALGRRVLTASAELTLRALWRLPRSPDPAGDVRRWLGLLGEVLRAPDGLQRLRAFVEYIRNVAEVDEAALHDAFAELGPSAEEVAMTAAERLREEGRRGAREEGRRAQAASTLLWLIEARFGVAPSEVKARVKETEVPRATLERWTRRVLTAASLQEVFADDEGSP